MKKKNVKNFKIKFHDFRKKMVRIWEGIFENYGMNYLI